jgi:hypothetical protein
MRGATPPANPVDLALHMCRNIRTLHNFDPPATAEDVRAASLQFVRKLCGFTAPSRANANLDMTESDVRLTVVSGFSRTQTRRAAHSRSAHHEWSEHDADSCQRRLSRRYLGGVRLKPDATRPAPVNVPGDASATPLFG